MSRNKFTWTLSVVLDENTNYYTANKFVSELADEIKKKMDANHIVGIAVPKLAPVRKQKLYEEK